MKIMFHSVNGVGLGHLNRTCNIANELRNNTDHEIVILTNARNIEKLESFGFRHYQLPNIGSDCINNDKVVSEIREIIDKEEPDVLVYDTFYSRELLSDIDLRKNITNVLILRIGNEKMYEYYLKDKGFFNFEKIIIPHTKEEFENLKIDISIKRFFLSNERVVFSGPIINNEIFKLKKYSNQSKNLLVVLGGGGHTKGEKINPNLIYDFIISHEKKLLEKFDNIEIIAGPYFENNKKYTGKIKIFGYVNNMEKYYENSSLIITTGGYNSVYEVFFSKRPQIIIPVDRILEDQNERALWFKDRYNAKIFRMNSNDSFFDVIENAEKSENDQPNVPIGNKIVMNEIIDAYGSLHIPLYNKCNNNCGLCEDLKQKPPRLHKTDVVNLISNFKNKEKITFYGGEPLMKNDILEFIEISKKSGFKKIIIKTNGRLLSDKNKVQKLVNAGVDNFLIYMFDKNEHDNITKVANSFKQTNTGIDNCKDIVEVDTIKIK